MEIWKIIKKNNVLKNESSSLSKTNKKLCDENEQLRKEVEELKSSPTISIGSLKIETENLNKEIFYLKKLSRKFTEGKRKFENMLGQQKSILNKKRLGYNMESKACNNFHSSVKCYYYREKQTFKSCLLCKKSTSIEKKKILEAQEL